MSTLFSTPSQRTRLLVTPLFGGLMAPVATPVVSNDGHASKKSLAAIRARERAERENEEEEEVCSLTFL